MYFWCKVMNVKLVSRCADIALFIPIGPRHSEKIAYEHIVSDIELSIVVEERPVNIHLHYVSLFSFFSVFIFLFVTIRLSCLQNRIQFVYLVYDSDSSALVAVFTWLYYPNVSSFCLSQALLFLCFGLLLDEFGSFVVVIKKTSVLRVFEAFSNVKSQRYIVKDVFANQAIVLFEIIKECFFVSKVKVVLQMVVNDNITVFCGKDFKLFWVLLQLKRKLPLFVFFELHPVFFVENLLFRVH